jgi:hypothetical protein
MVFWIYWVIWNAFPKSSHLYFLKVFSTWLPANLKLYLWLEFHCYWTTSQTCKSSPTWLSRRLEALEFRSSEKERVASSRWVGDLSRLFASKGGCTPVMWVLRRSFREREPWFTASASHHCGAFLLSQPHRRGWECVDEQIQSSQPRGRCGSVLPHL